MGITQSTWGAMKVTDAVNMLYQDMAGRSRAKACAIQILKSAELAPSECKRAPVMPVPRPEDCFPPAPPRGQDAQGVQDHLQGVTAEHLLLTALNSIRMDADSCDYSHTFGCPSKLLLSLLRDWVMLPWP